MSISFESRNDWDFAKFKHLFGAFGRFYNPPSTYPDVNPLRCEQKYHEGRRTSSKFKNLLCGLFPRFHRNEINSSKYYSPDQVVTHLGIRFREKHETGSGLDFGFLLRVAYFLFYCGRSRQGELCNYYYSYLYHECKYT